MRAGRAWISAPSNRSCAWAAGVSITAFLSSRDEKQLSLIALKRFCSENLPLYMIPDKFTWFDSLPKTSTDKIDYQKLKDMR